jgi:hypothetical protein
MLSLQPTLKWWNMKGHSAIMIQNRETERTHIFVVIKSDSPVDFSTHRFCFLHCVRRTILSRLHWSNYLISLNYCYNFSFWRVRQDVRKKKYKEGTLNNYPSCFMLVPHLYISVLSVNLKFNTNPRKKNITTSWYVQLISHYTQKMTCTVLQPKLN